MTPLLSITYTPQYQGCHRVCFRTTQQQYCCYLDNTGSVIGTPKTVDIYLSEYAECLAFIPSEISCNGDTTVTGYIQPCCSDENSLSNRTAFTATFASTECGSYTVECYQSGIGEITINNPGYGWPVGDTPTISIIDSLGYGSGFTAAVTMNCAPGDSFCSIDSISIVNPGSDFYDLNTLTVDISIPSCIGEQLIINGDFSDGLNNWDVDPIVTPPAWYISGGEARYAIETYGGTLPGSISQDVLTPGKSYNISFDLTAGVTNGTANIIVTAGTFDGSGTQPNQYLHVQNVGPLFTGTITATLPCIGTSEFSIYVESSTAETPSARVQVTNVSVTQECTVIEADAEVTLLEDCGTFTVPNCDGTDNPITYELLGNAAYGVNVCAGSSPDAPNYVVTAASEPYGPELLDTNPFNDSNFSDSGNIVWGPPSTCDFTVPSVSVPGWDPLVPIFPSNGTIQSPPFLEIGAQYRVLYTTYTDNPPNKTVRWTAGGLPIDVTVQNGLSTDVQIFIQANSTSLTALIFENQFDVCLYITSIRKVLTQVSCCDCRLYQVLVNTEIDIYYTDCNQTIDTVTVQTGLQGVTVCAIPNSIFTVNKLDRLEIISITEVGTCIPTE